MVAGSSSDSNRMPWQKVDKDIFGIRQNKQQKTHVNERLLIFCPGIGGFTRAKVTELTCVPQITLWKFLQFFSNVHTKQSFVKVIQVFLLQQKHC